MSFRKRKVGVQLKNTKKQDLLDLQDDIALKLGAENQNDGGAESKVSVEEIKLLQTVRKRQLGLEATSLVSQTASSRLSSVAASKESTPQAEESKQSKTDTEKNSTLMSLNAFTQQTNTLDTNKNMMKYIEEEMALFKKNTNERVRAEPGNQSILNTLNSAADPELESISAIEAKYMSNHYIENVGKKAETEGNIAVSTAMLTSINEVDLGIRSRLKNIEDTERAKKQLHLKRPSTNQPPETTDLQNVRYRVYNDPSANRKQPSDNIVVENFKKKFRY